MTSPLTAAAYGATFGTLAVFLILTLVFAFMNRRSGEAYDVDKFLSARNTQGAFSLTMSFFASGAGAWVLFAVPEATILGGPIALLGYAASTVVPLLIFACVAPALRRNLPWGITFFEFVQARYGTVVNVYVTLVAGFYLVLYLAAEFTSVGDTVALLSRVPPPAPNSTLVENPKLPPIIGTSLVTLVYTTFGGLPVSLLTDRVQGLGVALFTVLCFVALVGYSLFPTFEDLDAAKDMSKNWQTVITYGSGGTPANAFKMAVTLIIAVTSANLLHTGFQQRLWAGENNPAVRHGLWGAAILTVPFMLVFGLFGMVGFAHFGFGLFTPYTAFLSAFKLIQLMPEGWQLLAIILGVLMVASSADTIQTGLQGLFSPVILRMLTCGDKAKATPTNNKVALLASVGLTVILNIVAIVLATRGISVLTLFVLADLLAATCVVPVIMGLSEKVHPIAGLCGCVAGFVTALLIYGVGLPCEHLDEYTGLPLCDHGLEKGEYFELMKPGGLYSTTSLIAFVVTPLASGIVTLAVGLPLHLGGYKFAGYEEKAAPAEASTAAVSTATVEIVTP